MSTSEADRILCLQCQQVFLRLRDQEIYCCSHCGASEGEFANLTEDSVDITVAWQELQVIVRWAERWADLVASEDERSRMKRTVYGIADRLHSQYLDKPALTMLGEISDLRGEYGNVAMKGFHDDDL